MGQGRFAKNTKVTSARSRDEIEKTITRYGADQFAYGWQDDIAVVGFRLDGRNIRLQLPMPDKKSKEFTLTNTGLARSDSAAEKLHEQAIRQRWRQMLLLLKAKLEYIEMGFSSLDREFMADIMLPEGKTMGEVYLPQIKQAYLDGTMPKALPLP